MVKGFKHPLCVNFHNIVTHFCACCRWHWVSFLLTCIFSQAQLFGGDVWIPSDLHPNVCQTNRDQTNSSGPIWRWPELLCSISADILMYLHVLVWRGGGGPNRENKELPPTMGGGDSMQCHQLWECGGPLICRQSFYHLSSFTLSLPQRIVVRENLSWKCGIPCSSMPMHCLG